MDNVLLLFVYLISCDSMGNTVTVVPASTLKILSLTSISPVPD